MTKRGSGHQDVSWISIAAATAVGGLVGYGLGQQATPRVRPAGAAPPPPIDKSQSSTLLVSAQKEIVPGPRGPINVFSLASMVAGQPVDWSKIQNPIATAAKLLGLSADQLLDPKNPTTFPALLPLDQAVALLRHREWNPPDPGFRTIHGTCSWQVAGPFSPRGFDPFDANQGSIPNCHFIASLQALALTMPAALAARSTLRSDGRRDVSLYDGVAWRVVTLTERVPVFTPAGRSYSLGFGAGSGGIDYAPVVGTQIGWPGVFEKAFAMAGLNVTHDMPNLMLPSYWVPHEFDAAGLPAGSPVPPFTALTGRPTTRIDFARAPTAEIWRYFDAMCDADGVMRVPAKVETTNARSAADFLARRLVPEHAYAVFGSIRASGRNYLVLRNAWGNFNPVGDGTLTGAWRGRELGRAGFFALEASLVSQWFPIGAHVA